MANIAAFGEVMMRLEVPGYGLLSQGNTLHYSFSGTGVNVVSALSKFGHTSYLFSTLPDTPLGDAAKVYLQKLGIQTSQIKRGGKYIGSYFLENGFGNRPSRVTYTNRMESSFNTASTDSYSYEELAQYADVITFCGITLAMNDHVRSQMLRLAAAVKEKGGLVVFDCNYRPSLWGDDAYAKARPYYEAMLEMSDIVMLNEKDAIYTLGLACNTEDREEQLSQLIPQVAERYQIKTIAGTQRTIYSANEHALRGFMYQNSEFSFSVMPRFAVYDRIGAGDAFTSGIIHGCLQQFTPAETVEFATAAGMLAHTVAGDTPMATEREVLQAVSRRRNETVNDVER